MHSLLRVILACVALSVMPGSALPQTAPQARNIKNENRALHLVPIPYDRRLHDMYLPTTLSSEEYPNLLAPGETIDTIATSVLLVSFNWPEQAPSAEFQQFLNARSGLRALSPEETRSSTTISSNGIEGNADGHRAAFACS